jgi:phosphopantothenoylcysteine decarboxylase/phosphopantothenate--cysteine ligase
MKIALGISASIAAYRSVDFLKELKALGWQVRCVLSSQAHQFVSPLVLETFSGEKVYQSNIFDPCHFGTEHIAAARWADCFFIYGASANTIAKLAHGFADDFLTLQILAYDKKILVAPAMNPQMWKNPALQKNVSDLKSRGFVFIDPIAGRVACGEEGVGHLASHQSMIENLKIEASLMPENDLLSDEKPLKGKNILISAGPMRTALDTVRYLQNRSSGLSAYEMAKEAWRLGGKIKVLLGPVELKMRERFLEVAEVYHFQSAQDYASQLDVLFPQCHFFLSAAAVLDFDLKASGQKIEKDFWLKDKKIIFDVESLPDFVKKMSDSKAPQQKVIAFALQSGDENSQIQKAKNKLKAKNADAILLNTAAFNEGPEMNESHFRFITPQGDIKDYGLLEKSQSAKLIWQDLLNLS